MWLLRSGPAWTAGQTLSSVLLSIQTLLCPQPMRNEPGYENHHNTAELTAYNNIIQHETLRVALVSNVKGILNGTSYIPTELHEAILTRLSDHLAYVTKVCRKMGPSLDKKVMKDPFGEPRGVFAFNDILKQFLSINSSTEGQKAELDVDEEVIVVTEGVDEKMELKEKKIEPYIVNDKKRDDENEAEEEAIPEELKCGVCFDILATPAVLECGHVFCYLCALRWLERNPICPTCRQNQTEVTKLRRIFTLDMICDREAKSRNKSLSQTDDAVPESVLAKSSKDSENCNDLDSAVFESSYALWCSRRDEGIALDNGKRLEASKPSGRQLNHQQGSYDGFDDDEYDDEYNIDEYGSDNDVYDGHHLMPGMSYFNHVIGSGNVLGSSSSLESSSSIETEEVKRAKEKEARLKRFAGASGNYPPPVTDIKSPKKLPTPQIYQHHVTSRPEKQCNSHTVSTTTPFGTYLSAEDREELKDKKSRAAELERIKREKAEKARERKRLQIEIEHDRRERKKNCGVLPGSHDSLFSSKANVEVHAQQDGSSCGAHQSKSSVPSDFLACTGVDKKMIASRKVDSLLDMICKPYAPTSSVTISSSGEVDVALNLILKVLGNIVENPHVKKYRAINTLGKMYKEKLARVIGVQRLLNALGFKKEASGSLVLDDVGDSATDTNATNSELNIITETRDKILSIVECRKISLES